MLRKVIVAAAALSTMLAAPALAAPPGPTGTIELIQPAAASSAEAATTTNWPQYGDTVAFSATVDGKISKQADIYVTVVCTQGTTVVYQSSGAPEASFPLQDQAGQGLEWDGGAADCSATLVHRVKKGKNIDLDFLATTTFEVAGV